MRRLALLFVLLPSGLAAQRDTVRLGPGSPLLDGIRRYRDHHLATTIIRKHGDSTLSEVRYAIDVLRVQDGTRAIEHVTVGPLQGAPDPGVQITTLLDSRTTLPLHYELHTGNGAVVNVGFDGTHVTGQRRVAADSALQPVDLTLREPAFLAAYEDAALDAVNLKQGMVLRVPVVSFAPSTFGNVQSYIYRVLRRDTVQAEGRRIPAWVVESRDSVNTNTIWLIDEPPYTTRWLRISVAGRSTDLTQVLRPVVKP